MLVDNIKAYPMFREIVNETPGKSYSENLCSGSKIQTDNPTLVLNYEEEKMIMIIAHRSPNKLVPLSLIHV